MKLSVCLAAPSCTCKGLKASRLCFATCLSGYLCQCISKEYLPVLLARSCPKGDLKVKLSVCLAAPSCTCKGLKASRLCFATCLSGYLCQCISKEYLPVLLARSCPKGDLKVKLSVCLAAPSCTCKGLKASRLCFATCLSGYLCQCISKEYLPVLLARSCPKGDLKVKLSVCLAAPSCTCKGLKASRLCFATCLSGYLCKCISKKYLPVLQQARSLPWSQHGTCLKGDQEPVCFFLAIPPGSGLLSAFLPASPAEVGEVAIYLAVHAFWVQAPKNAIMNFLAAYPLPACDNLPCCWLCL